MIKKNFGIGNVLEEYMAETGVGYVGEKEDSFSKQQKKYELIHYKFQSVCQFNCPWCDVKFCPFIKFMKIIGEEL